MKLGSRGRYAVMALVDMAIQGHNSPICLASIAERQGLSVQYLEQLFSKLRRSGIVKSVRGQGGGYLFARPETKISIAEVVLAVEEPVKVTRCQPGSGLGCQGKKSRCLTHNLWENLGAQIMAYLDRVTLADVASGDLKVSPLPQEAEDLNKSSVHYLGVS